MTTPSMPIPAGWYPDPAGSFQQRWWTGESWTNDFAQYRPTLVHSAPAQEVLLTAAEQPAMQSDEALLEQQRAAAARIAAQFGSQQNASYGPTQTLTRDQPVAAPAAPFRLPDADQPPQTMVAQPNAGNATLIPVAPAHRSTSFGADFATEYQPFGSTTEVRRGVRLNPDRRYTASVWLLAVVPILALGGAAYAIATLIPVLYTTLTQALLVLFFLVISATLAALDRRVLYRDGHDSTAAPALALLTPLTYLVARTVLATRETARNTMGPLVLLLVVIAGVAAALVFVGGLLPLLVTANSLY